MSDLCICLHHGPSIGSKLIRWQTRSHWNHAAFLLDDGRLLESVEGRGVIATRTLADARERDEDGVWCGHRGRVAGAGLPRKASAG